MFRRRKTLPKDFDAILAGGDIEAMKRVFDDHDVEARGGVRKVPALAAYDCPPELARWLVARGADVDTRDGYGRTPLHALAGVGRDVAHLVDLGAEVDARANDGATPPHVAAAAHQAAVVRTLLPAGADPSSRNTVGDGPVDLCLRRASNATLGVVGEIVGDLVAAGAPTTAAQSERVAALAADLARWRDEIEPDVLGPAQAGLARLDEVFHPEPLPTPPARHDGTSRITITATEWPEQHAELWSILVPSMGPARTVQGEVVRISGRVANEINGNGSINWDDDFRAMLGWWAARLGTAQAADTARRLRRGKATEEEVDALAEQSVRWVLAHPDPQPLPTPVDYRR